MINAFKAEWRKLRQRPAVWVLGGIMLAAIFLFGYAITWPAAIDILKALGATWLIFESWSLFGMALAFLFRQSAMAIGIGLAYVLAIEGILFRLLRGFDASWLTTVEKFFLGQNAGALIKSFGQPYPAPGAAAPIVTAGVAVLVLVAYSLVFAGVTSLVVRRRDVT